MKKKKKIDIQKLTLLSLAREFGTELRKVILVNERKHESEKVFYHINII